MAEDLTTNPIEHEDTNAIVQAEDGFEAVDCAPDTPIQWAHVHNIYRELNGVVEEYARKMREIGYFELLKFRGGGGFVQETRAYNFLVDLVNDDQGSRTIAAESIKLAYSPFEPVAPGSSGVQYYKEGLDAVAEAQEFNYIKVKYPRKVGIAYEWLFDKNKQVIDQGFRQNKNLELLSTAFNYDTYTPDTFYLTEYELQRNFGPRPPSSLIVSPVIQAWFTPTGEGPLNNEYSGTLELSLGEKFETFLGGVFNPASYPTSSVPSSISIPLTLTGVPVSNRIEVLEELNNYRFFCRKDNPDVVFTDDLPIRVQDTGLTYPLTIGTPILLEEWMSSVQVYANSSVPEGEANPGVENYWANIPIPQEGFEDVVLALYDRETAGPLTKCFCCQIVPLEIWDNWTSVGLSKPAIDEGRRLSNDIGGKSKYSLKPGSTLDPQTCLSEGILYWSHPLKLTASLLYLKRMTLLHQCWLGPMSSVLQTDCQG